MCVLLLIVARIWHLSVIQSEDRKKDAFKPRKRVVYEPAVRGTIRDRFNTLLAGNKIDYRLSILYSQFQEIPRIYNGKDQTGKIVKRFLRKEYIEALSKKMSAVLKVDPKRIEDLIYSHAAQNNTVPFVLKEGLSERQYYELKMLEKDYPGLIAERIPKRYYPHGKSMCHILGYMQPMPYAEYQSIIQELHHLEEEIKNIEFETDSESLPLLYELKKRFSELQQRAYTINDYVGALGVESTFEDDLRGYYGKKIYFTDAKGNCVRKLTGCTNTTNGKRLLLSLSLELQQYAEELLSKSETLRSKKQRKGNKKEPSKEPWIRGGAIVAIDPKNGQVIACASYPRFDPNDFLKSNKRYFQERTSDDVLRWIESEDYYKKVWEQKLPLQKEMFDFVTKSATEERTFLSWNMFLELILPYNDPIHEKIRQNRSIKEILDLQKAFAKALDENPLYSPQHVINAMYPAPNSIEIPISAIYKKLPSLNMSSKAVLDQWFKNIQSNQEKLLLLDLTRLITDYKRISPEIEPYVTRLTIDKFRELEMKMIQFIEDAQEFAKLEFSSSVFEAWRKTCEKEFLQQCRFEEKEKGAVPKPYCDLLDNKKRELFSLYWDANFEELLEKYLYQEESSTNPELVEWICKIPQDLRKSFLSCFRSPSDLDEPLYCPLKKSHFGPVLTCKDLALSFRFFVSPGSLRSLAYRGLSAQGSIFKLVTAYSALKQKYEELQGKMGMNDCALFDIDDRAFSTEKGTAVGRFSNGSPIMQMYKGGRIPKTLIQNVGKIDLFGAIEYSSNPYFALIAKDYLKEPCQLIDAAKEFGYAEKSQILLPFEARGRLPTDLESNMTGLYTTAIGQHTIEVTPLQTAMMLSAITNGGKLYVPQLVQAIVGKNPTSEQNEIITPDPLVRRSIFMPDVIRKALLSGMRRVMEKVYRDQSRGLLEFFKLFPNTKKDFYSMRKALIGKTSTAECQERIALDLGQSRDMHNHAWYSGISFERQNAKSFVFRDEFNNPELVVVVLIRYGSYGKEAAPLACLVAKKWQTIKKRR